MESNFNFESRAKKLRTGAHVRKQAEKESAGMFIKNTYTKEEYWKQFVKSPQDIEKFYQVYYPEYPTELQRAIAIRIGNLMEKVKMGQPLTIDEQSYFKEPSTSTWDPTEELKKEELAAKVQMAVKHLEELSHG